MKDFNIEQFEEVTSLIKKRNESIRLKESLIDLGLSDDGYLMLLYNSKRIKPIDIAAHIGHDKFDSILKVFRTLLESEFNLKIKAVNDQINKFEIKKDL